MLTTHQDQLRVKIIASLENFNDNLDSTSYTIQSTHKVNTPTLSFGVYNFKPNGNRTYYRN